MQHIESVPKKVNLWVILQVLLEFCKLRPALNFKIILFFVNLTRSVSEYENALFFVHRLYTYKHSLFFMTNCRTVSTFLSISAPIKAFFMLYYYY